MFRANNFDKLLDKATSNFRLDPDWPTILQICDLIRQNDCTPKYAIAGVKKKLYSQNPHQAMFALLTLESIVKNCGSAVHDEVASKQFCEMLRDLVKTTQHENLRSKILELIQAWAFAFRNAPKYRAVQDTVNILKSECYKFPPLKESDAMFSADAAPEWADGEVCHRCRVAFSLMVRRHHCRACGQVFCQQCSSKTSTLPKFGIEKEVRVCDACYDKVSKPPSSSAKLEIVDTATDYGSTTQPQKRPGKSAEELQEEEELQLALALSQSEAEQKEKERRSRSHISTNAAAQHPTVSPSASSVSSTPEPAAVGAGGGGGGGAELTRYLDRGYWEQRVASQPPAAPTAPDHTSEPSDSEYSKPSTANKSQEDDAEDKEIDEFVSTLKSQVEIFVNRMKSNSSRGRSIANDTSVQTLFMNITAMHSRLLRYIQQQDDKRVYLESLQDKVTQVRDSRLALDTLRAEHAARLAAAAAAADRQRQMQMAAKLDAMRKKKHEYLQYQRQLALQRVQEQEREMQMRQEQQKHQYMMSANSGYYPATYPQQVYAPSYLPHTTADNYQPMPSQAQMSQANIPQHTQPNAMYTAAPNTQAQNPPTAMPQPNVRQPMPQQLPVQQMMMQMRMNQQPGVHQMMPNVPNGIPVQQQSQQNGHMPKTSQPQAPNQMMPQMSVPQTTAGQAQMNVTNPMLGMQMPNMRMPMMPGAPNQPQQIPGYPVNLQNPIQMPGQQSQMMNQGQPMSLPGHQMMPGHNLQGQPMSIPHMAQNNQNLPQGAPVPQSQPQQMSQNKPMQIPNQPGMPMQQNIPPQGVMPPGQGISQGQPQPMTSQGLPIQMPGQVMQNPHMVPQSMPSQMPQPGQSQMPQPGQPQMPQPGQPQPVMQQMPQQQVPNQGPPVNQQGQNIQMPPPGQQIKVAAQSFNAPQMVPPAQQPQAPVKSESNNNTAELISFD